MNKSILNQDFYYALWIKHNVQYKIAEDKENSREHCTNKDKGETDYVEQSLDVEDVYLKVFEMIIFNRLVKFGKHKGYFSHLQVGFKAGTGCMEASLLINEAINYFLERGGNVFSCFLDVRKLLTLSGLMVSCINCYLS